MNIQPVTDSDIEAIKSIVFGVLKEYGLEPDSNITDSDLESLDDSFSANGGYYFGIVRESGRIVGTVSLYRIDDATCELRKMYVLPRQCGKGLEKNLMEIALLKAIEIGFKRVILETASPLKEAIGLYKRYGFSKFKPKHLSAHCDQAM